MSTAPALDDRWRDAAACRGHDRADWWFSNDPDEQAQAIAVCGRCTVRDACLLDAELRGETDGIRGGRIRGGRGPARRNMAAEVSPVALPEWVDHGTNTAANSYGCKCSPCREVKAAAQRQTKARRKLEQISNRGGESTAPRDDLAGPARGETRPAMSPGDRGGRATDVVSHTGSVTTANSVSGTATPATPPTPCGCGGFRCRLDGDDERHGTMNCYGNHHCRCARCRTAAVEYYRAREREAAEARTCPNCAGPGGLMADGECRPCYEYRRKNGVRRPREVFDPPPRQCVNCDRFMDVGEHLRRGRCEACARYLDRNGVERPERLWAAQAVAS